jgi:predicted dehydrogenase
VRWGIVGCGWVARDYVAPAILAAPHARLAALCDPDAAASARIAALAPSDSEPACFQDLDAFLAAPELDAVYIATPNHLHARITIAAARAGKHVLCEKPMSTGLAEARSMVAACRDAGVVYATAFDQRFQARHQKLRQLVQDGTLGTVTAARIHYACWTPRDWTPESGAAHDNWRVDPARAGGGAFIDLAPHGLDLLQFLLGEPITEVASMLQSRAFDYEVDDGAALIARFESGSLALMNVAYNCPDAFPRRTLELIGTRAMAIARDTMGQTPGGSLRLVDAQSGDSREIEVAPEEDVSPFQNQVESFSNCLLMEETFPFPPERDLHTMRLLEIAQQSQGGTCVEPEPTPEAEVAQ